MNESTMNRMIREHKEHLIWLSVFLVLAVFVTALVFGTLRRSVQAQTYTKRVFVCASAQEGAEPVAHKHNDDCYENGELICTLPERELHIHGDECYAEEKVLVCTLEEGEGHVHTDACYTEEPVLVCGLEENNGHVHSVENGCYTRVQGDLICTDEDPEHVHTDECYTWEEVLTCEIPEGDGAHHHSEECYETQRVLSCGKEEGEGAHTHDDTCYEIQKVLICDKEEVKTEHVHTVDCFQVVDMSPEEIHALHMSELPESDPTADVESPDVWESRFASVPLSGEWDRDLLKIAETQLGYTESQRNFDAVLNEDGEGYTLKGWTRYGAWYGIPYGDWCAMFISFCLNYADIPESAIPYDCATTTWIDSLSVRGMYAPAGSYDPKPGDLIFFDWEGDGLSDHVGIVWAVNPGSITTIEGNHTISVELFDYDLSDGHIQGYGILPENPELAAAATQDTEPADDASTGTDVENVENNNEETDADVTGDAVDAADSDAVNAADAAGTTAEGSANAEPAVNMPPFSYSERVAGMRVSIDADEGAFPEGTTVKITAIEDDGIAEQVAPAVSGQVVKVQAVDITFYDADHNEIEPQIPIRVTMRPFSEAEEANGVEVVHVDNDGAVNTVETDDSIAQPDKGAAFDADSFSKYVLVYVLKFEYEVNGKTFESELAGGEDLLLSSLLEQLGACEEGQGLEFVSKIASATPSDPEVLKLTEVEGNWTVCPLKESEVPLSLAIEMQDGAKFSVQVQAIGKTEVKSEDENTVVTAVNELLLPENASVSSTALTEEESADAIAAVEKVAETESEENTAYQVYDISLDSVNCSNYDDGFQVSLTLSENVAGKDFEVYHVDEEGNATRLETVDTDAVNLTDETDLVSTVSFVTPSFDQFVIRYTVDFHYNVNGKYYQFSMAGGKFASLEQLLELIGIANLDTQEENEENKPHTETEEETVLADLDNIVVSDETRAFVSNIENVTFSNTDYVWVGKVEYDTTVGELKAANNLICQYSAELTEEQIAAIDVRKVTAGDWALISEMPFFSEESLVIMMNNGDVFTIRVTDDAPEYIVRINLDSNAYCDIAADEGYYVYVKATYGNGDIRCQYAPLVITEADRGKGYIDYQFPNWKDDNLNEKSKTDTNGCYNGAESTLQVYLLKLAVGGTLRPNEINKSIIWTDGKVLKTYEVNYTEPSDWQNRAPEETNSQHHIDNIYLSTIAAEGEYNYSSILGPNLYYGIVADHLYQTGHMQTSFAVNHYTGTGQDDRPDLSGNHSGSIVIAQYNYHIDGSYGNHIGSAVHDAVPAGQINVGNPLNGTLVLYVDSGSGSEQPISSNGNNGKVRGNYNNTVVIQKPGYELSESFVDPAITHLTAISGTLASKPVTINPPVPPGTAFTLDTTGFADDATIYVNADPLKSVIATTGSSTDGLTIKKKDNQTIVFNFTDDVSELWLKKFRVVQPKYPNGFDTNSPEGKNSPDNEKMDEIARHIVWNLNGITGKTYIQTGGGMILQPNSVSEIEVVGTTAGWIASAGYVKVASGEWHHVFSDVPDSNQVAIRAQKTVDGKAPRSSQKFTFKLEEWENNAWNVIEADRTNVTGSIDFRKISDLTPGWHVYKISETGKATGTNGDYANDTTEYYAAVFVESFSGGHTVAYAPVYYSSFNPSEFHTNGDGLPGVSGKLTTSSPVFKNYSITQGLSLSKTVKGTNSQDKEFTFEIKLWNEDDKNQKTPLDLSEPQQFPVTGLPGVSYIEISNQSDETFSRGEIKLKNGQTAVITELPDGVHYEITEIKIGENPVDNSAEYVDGYKPVTASPQTGVFNGSARVAFINEYRAETKVQIVAKKELIGQDLAAGEFTFELHKNSPTGPVIHFDSEPITNAAPESGNTYGKVTFGEIEYKIDYSQTPSVDDLAGATVNSNGTREKIFTYYICEVKDNEEDIEYAEPVEVKIKVVDDGVGHLTAFLVGETDPITVYDDDGELTDYICTLPDSKKIVNKVKGGITVNKEWFGGDAADRPGSIQFDLYRTTDPIAAGSAPDNISNGNTITINNTSPELVTFIGNNSISCEVGSVLVFTVTAFTQENDHYKADTLHIVDINNNYKTYKCVNIPISGGNTQSIEVPVENDMSDLNIVSYYGVFTVAVSVKGENNSAALSRADLLSLVESHATEKVNDEALVISSANSWSWSSGPLEKFDSNKNPWTYFVMERTPTGYQDSYILNGDTITINNKQETSLTGKLTINKRVFLNGNQDLSTDEREFKVGIYYDELATNPVEGKSPQTIKVSAGASTGSVTVGGLSFGTYYVYELDKDNQPIKEGSGTINGKRYEVTQDHPCGVVSSTSAAATVTITNERIPDIPLEIRKVDKNHSSTMLSGAEFTLTKLFEKQNRIANGEMPYNSAVVYHFGPTEDGVASSKEVEPGWYEVKETKVPDGYVLNSDSTFYIKIDKTGEIHQVIPAFDIPENWSVTDTAFGNVLSFTAAETGKPACITIGNVPGQALPNSGGPGTALYTLLGGLMVVTAGAVLTLRKKKNKA